MARGNQRELARAKAAKKSSDSGKGQRKDEMSHSQRMEHDRKMIQEKQAAKAAAEAAKAAAK
ncbi:small EDRK-rich factor 1 [Phlyctochytrium arcticum]|nr:small EDRK-rich factor 1 [Phlyctochytrium arcticum]